VNPTGKAGDQIPTIGSILRKCEEYFRSKGCETPRLDAELLLAHVLGWPRIRLYVEWDRELSEEELSKLRGLAGRRARGEPVAYLTGVREFWSMPFVVDRRVLIPRPETEHVVEAVIEIVAENGLAQPRIADIGTGCGNIACALAKSLPTAKIIATDISREALEVAEENARRLDLSERIEFVQGDLVDPLRGRGVFDVIASNPPYVAAGQWQTLPVSVRAFEPRVALFDDSPDGLGTVKRLITESLAVLKRPGYLVLELGAGQSGRALQQAQEAGYAGVKVKKDLAGVERVLVAELR